MGHPAWRFEGNERKYIEEVLSSGYRAGADGAFTTRLEKIFLDTYKTSYGIADGTLLHLQLPSSQPI